MKIRNILGVSVVLCLGMTTLGFAVGLEDVLSGPGGVLSQLPESAALAMQGFVMLMLARVARRSVIGTAVCAKNPVRRSAGRITTLVPAKAAAK